MNWPIILNISAVVIGGIASAFTYCKKNKIAFIVGLCVVAINGVLIFVKPKDRSSQVPVINASVTGRLVRIIAVNPDQELPIKDVSIKVQGHPTIQIGTMYPSVVHEIHDECVTKSTIIVVSVWYNETKRMEADFDVKMGPDSTFKIEATYLDAKGALFVPEWKQNPPKNGTDTTTHYNPTLFK